MYGQDYSTREIEAICGCSRSSHMIGVTGVALTPDGIRAISGSWDTTLKVWNISALLNAGLASGVCLATFCADGPLDACAISTDGRTVGAAGASGRGHLLRWET